VLDAAVSKISDPGDLDRRIVAIPGVLGTGLFIGMADAVVIQDGEAVEVRRR
jgi:ribose 5-phosphate isomerase A